MVALDPAPRGVRLVLDDLRSGAFADRAGARPHAGAQGGETLHAGDGVDLTARLMPPPGPSEPGDSDFGRAAFFQGIGAVGFAYGAPIPRRSPHAPDAFGARCRRGRESAPWR